MAINASRNPGRGPTSLLLESFLDGLREAGAEVDSFYARDLMITPQRIAVRTSGKRRARDGMQRLRRWMGRSDLLVLASPLYYDGRTGPEEATSSLRKLMEGLTPGMREPSGPGKIVIASGSGFWEITGGGVMLRGALPGGVMDWDMIGVAREAGYGLVAEKLTTHDLARREAVTRDFYGLIVSSSPATEVAPCAASARWKCALKED